MEGVDEAGYLGERVTGLGDVLGGAVRVGEDGDSRVEDPLESGGALGWGHGSARSTALRHPAGGGHGTPQRSRVAWSNL